MTLSIKEEWVFRIYDLAKAGFSETRVAKAIGVSTTALPKLFLKQPILKQAFVEGQRYYSKKQGRPDVLSFNDFVFDSLPPEMKVYWGRLNKIGNWICKHCGKPYDEKPKEKCNHCKHSLFKRTSKVELIEALMEEGGETVRKWMFVYAWMCDCNFSLPRALKKVNISRSTFDRWVVEDRDFKKMIKQVTEYKKDFIEDAAMDLVMMREPSIIKFLLQTIGRDRGFGLDEKIINNFGDTNIQNNTILLEQLPLPLRKQVLSYVRENKELPEAKTG